MISCVCVGSMTLRLGFELGMRFCQNCRLAVRGMWQWYPARWRVVWQVWQVWLSWLAHAQGNVCPIMCVRCTVSVCWLGLILI